MRWGRAQELLLSVLPLTAAIGIVAMALWWYPRAPAPAHLVASDDACATLTFSNPQNQRLGMQASFRRGDCPERPHAACKDAPEWCSLEVTEETLQRLFSAIDSARERTNDAPADGWDGALPITHESRSGVQTVVITGGEGTCKLLHDVTQLLPEKSPAARGFVHWMGNYATYVDLISRPGCAWMAEVWSREPVQGDPPLNE